MSGARGTGERHGREHDGAAAGGDPAAARDAADAADAQRRRPRGRRMPRTRAAQAKLDAAAQAFRPAPFAFDAAAARRPIGPRIAAWLAAQDRQPFAFQEEVWREIARGASGLLHATTGAGKTWAVWLGALAAYAGDEGAAPLRPTARISTARARTLRSRARRPPCARAACRRR
ncbi:hypothetical protein B7760_04420 [Burkholderia glumae]|nr:hypothetical protein B7760_04420 [Burkholderia glumae]